MENKILSSELIINENGSIYHCNIRPEDLADTVILVGDPERVPKVSKFFDSIEVQSQKREIITHTGYLNGKRLTVISTGMGTDNIDIVLNELDALANIDLEKREIKDTRKTLTFVRLGTSGSLQKDVPVDSLVASEKGLGLDGLMAYYKGTDGMFSDPLIGEFVKQTKWDGRKAKPYIIEGSEEVLELLTNNSNVVKGITATAIGFYGPQGRKLRLELEDKDLNDKLSDFSFGEEKITNFEMETSAIYGLSSLLGHKALSLNTIIANRRAGTFSKDANLAVENMIKYALERLTK